jgi:hypothetical protein
MGLSRLIKKLLRYREPELPMRTTKKLCGVFFDRMGIYVFASHYDTRGWTPYGEPMTAIDYSASPIDVGEAIVRSINGTRTDLLPEEYEHQMENALSITPWRTWDEVDRKCGFVSICFEPSTDLAEIRHMHRYSTGGHILVKGDPVYTSSLDAKEIGELVHKLIHGPQPPVIEATPSHT